MVLGRPLFASPPEARENPGRIAAEPDVAQRGAAEGEESATSTRREGSKKVSNFPRIFSSGTSGASVSEADRGGDDDIVNDADAIAGGNATVDADATAGVEEDYAADYDNIDVTVGDGDCGGNGDRRGDVAMLTGPVDQVCVA